MSIVFGFVAVVILLLATGCAAPLSKVVSTRQGGTIDRQLFKIHRNFLVPEVLQVRDVR